MMRVDVARRTSHVRTLQSCEPVASVLISVSEKRTLLTDCAWPGKCWREVSLCVRA
jgi:hypothetical protein